MMSYFLVTNVRVCKSFDKGVRVSIRRCLEYGNLVKVVKDQLLDSLSAVSALDIARKCCNVLILVASRAIRI